MEKGGTWEGKRSGGVGEVGGGRSGGGRSGIRRRRRNGESINLLGRQVTEFLTKSCMVAYEW